MLIAFGGLVGSGCYAPAVRDCTITCSAPTECASGQVCDADGFCASPSAAGTCGAAIDAGVHPSVDAPVDPSVDAPVDATVTIELHVKVGGTGKVVVGTFGECSTEGPADGDCRLQVPRGVIVRLDPIEIAADKPFEHWVSSNCAQQGTTCTLLPFAATTAEAKFK